MLLDNWFTLLASVSQVYLKSYDGAVIALLVKIVDDFLARGPYDVVDAIIFKLQKCSGVRNSRSWT